MQQIYAIHAIKIRNNDVQHDMQHIYAIDTCNEDMQGQYAIKMYNENRQYKSAIKICNDHMSDSMSSWQGGDRSKQV